MRKKGARPRKRMTGGENAPRIEIDIPKGEHHVEESFYRSSSVHGIPARSRINARCVTGRALHKSRGAGRRARPRLPPRLYDERTGRREEDQHAPVFDEYQE